jgi:hypothetical protein
MSASGGSTTTPVTTQPNSLVLFIHLYKIAPGHYYSDMCPIPLYAVGVGILNTVDPTVNTVDPTVNTVDPTVNTVSSYRIIHLTGDGYHPGYWPEDKRPSVLKVSSFLPLPFIKTEFNSKFSDVLRDYRYDIVTEMIAKATLEVCETTEALVEGPGYKWAHDLLFPPPPPRKLRKPPPPPPPTPKLIVGNTYSLVQENKILGKLVSQKIDGSKCIYTFEQFCETSDSYDLATEKLVEFLGMDVITLECSETTVVLNGTV